MYSLEQAEAWWLEAGNHGTPAERRERALRWTPFYASMAERSMGKPFKTPKDVLRTVDFLSAQGVISPGDRLLDLGAGMGGYSLEFARRGLEVTALDVNASCLKLIESRADECALENVSTVPLMWEDYTADRPFDIVFSSMCPALCNPEELKKAEAMARKTVCILTVTRGSCNKHRMKLMEHFGVRGRGGMVTEALHYYNTLYLMGRQPNVKCWTDRSASTSDVESQIRHFERYFKLFGVEERVSVPYMERYFAECAKDGVVEDETVMNRALIYWTVPENETEREREP